jgi:hypothetical protein
MQPELGESGAPGDKSWTHDDLASDLAGHLRTEERMTWQDMQLGPSGSQRPDVYAMFRSYSKPNPTAYECKVSKADFREDITTGKWRGYLKFAWAVVFAAPAGLIAKTEIPEMCGLILRHDRCWRWAKKPTIQPTELRQDCWLKLLIDGVKREGPAARARNWRQLNDGQLLFAKRFGDAAAKYVRDAARIEGKIQAATKRAEDIVAEARLDAERVYKFQEQMAPKLWNDLTAALNVPVDAPMHEVQSAVACLRAGISPEAMVLRDVISSLQRIVDIYAPRVAIESETAEANTRRM